MPELLRYRGWKFFFYSKEGEPLEPPHVHVRKAGQEAKIWLSPEIRFAWDRRIDPREQKMLLEIVTKHRIAFEERWNVHFAGTR